MNCKPGDMAVIVREAQENTPDLLLGRLCTVVEEATPGDYIAPNGETWVDVGANRWLVRLQSSITVTRISGEQYRTEYIVAPDRVLRPIRPGDVTDSEVRDLYAPQLPEVA